MAFQYRAVQVSLPGEDASRLSSESTSTLRAVDDLDYLSRDSELYYKSSIRESASGWVRSKWLWVIHAALLLTSCSMLVSTLLLRSSTLHHVRQTSAWCKWCIWIAQEDEIADNLPTQHRPTHLCNTSQSDITSHPRAIPSLALDPRWTDYGGRYPTIVSARPFCCVIARSNNCMKVGDQWIPKSDISKLDMPETSLKVNHPTTGEEGYRVGMEVFHHLHCLNLLRRVTYREYYEPLGGEFSHGREALQAHTGKRIPKRVIDIA